MAAALFNRGQESRRQWLADAYLAACALELDALKPGNVHRESPGHGMTVDDFLRSAEVSAGPLTQPGLGLGERIFHAVAATREAVGCNTNLGILLLCAPLIQAALESAGGGDLRERLADVLGAADRRETDWLFQAIRLAAPGGLGASAEHDVSGTATGSPLEVMCHAAHRDLIARQYADGFQDLFERAVPLLAGLDARWQAPAWAAAGLYLDFLGRYPDSHIARKFGLDQAVAVAGRAAPLAAALTGAARPEPYAEALRELDRVLKGAGINPGTSADLTVACLLIRGLECQDPNHLSAADARRIPRTGPVIPAPVLSL
ncbi:MAG TPA: triphosphoribosyl-dephospho-CoA synthase [Lamprocystis sp. (in: g-proteobacteria)]|nr:triphosphoribosyl-dephospho-CoA synthase [Lamprocystis sp. (in: g-proteobacteria)]